MNAPTSPPGDVDDRATVTLTCSVAWPDGRRVTAALRARDAGQTVPVVWTGAVDQLERPPDLADSALLAVYLQDQAERNGGTFEQKQDGLWPAMDEVKI
jgi:hypothetical protein